jgi:hypothetical protein
LPRQQDQGTALVVPPFFSFSVIETNAGVGIPLMNLRRALANTSIVKAKDKLPEINASSKNSGQMQCHMWLSLQTKLAESNHDPNSDHLRPNVMDAGKTLENGFFENQAGNVRRIRCLSCDWLL